MRFKNASQRKAVMSKLWKTQGHPVHDLKYYVDRDKVLPEPDKPRQVFENHDKYSISTFQKANHIDGRYKQAIPYPKNQILEALKHDHEWELKNRGNDFYPGNKDGSPSVNYLRLMKGMGIANPDNYAQWVIDGKTDKEIFDIFFDFAKKERNHILSKK